MTKNKFKDEAEYNNMLSVNSNSQILKVKEEINRLIPKDIKIIAKNESQIKLINSIKNNEITICSGLAGSGKTFVAVAFALNLLTKLNNRYKKIYLVKSVTALKGEELGYLKGDLNEKIGPFMWSFYKTERKSHPSFLRGWDVSGH